MLHLIFVRLGGLVVKKWNHPNRTARPSIDGAAMASIERMARDNIGRDYRRNQRELLKLGHRVVAPTVSRVLKRLRIPPALSRETDVR